MAEASSVRRTERRPLSIYLDQSVYGHFLNESESDWTQADLARLLLEAQARQVGQVWASPTHAMETLQTTDPLRRCQLARIILELIDGRRMTHSHELETIRHFMEFLKLCAPEAIRYPQFLNERVETTRRIWLGGLALIAATAKLTLDPLVQTLRRVKTTSRLLHARFAVSPGNWVDEMLRTIEEQRTTTGDPFAGFEDLTVDQMEAEIMALEPQFVRLDSRDLARLNRERGRLSRAYGAVELGRMLETVFTLPMELQFIFNIPHLVEHWSAVRQKTGCKALPKNILEAGNHALLSDPALTREVLQQAIYAVANIGLVPATIAFEIVLRDLQKSINGRQIPTGGLTFDGDHAVALSWCDVFVSRDESFTESAKTIAKRIEAETCGRRRVDVVATEEQLSKALERKDGAYKAAETSVGMVDWSTT
jgi:hypothetical protein